MEVKDYWDKFWESRVEPGSQNDKIFQKLSHEKIYESLVPCNNLLIIGCGDGDGIDLYEKRAYHVTGVDFSREAIEKAMIRFPQHGFGVANILHLDTILKPGAYEAIISERCITNLGSMGEQLQALKVVKNLLEDDGVFYMCEPTLQGYDELDHVRQSMGLSKIKRHWHNLLLDDRIIDESGLRILFRENFGIYSLISRVLYPLYVYPEEPTFDSKMNEIAREISKNIGYGGDLPSQHTLFALIKE